MGLLAEFKEFALRGNVMDMAVGIIIGGAFNKIVSSMVDDMVMPPIGVLLGGRDFSNLAVPLAQKTLEDGTVETVAIQYGAFIQTTLDFCILAAVIFLMVKGINILRRKQQAEPAPAAPPAPPPQEVLLAEIRDLLKQR